MSEYIVPSTPKPSGSSGLGVSSPELLRRRLNSPKLPAGGGYSYSLSPPSSPRSSPKFIPTKEGDIRITRVPSIEDIDRGIYTPPSPSTISSSTVPIERAGPESEGKVLIPSEVDNLIVRVVYWDADGTAFCSDSKNSGQSVSGISRIHPYSKRCTSAIELVNYISEMIQNYRPKPDVVVVVTTGEPYRHSYFHSTEVLDRAISTSHDSADPVSYERVYRGKAGSEE